MRAPNPLALLCLFLLAVAFPCGLTTAQPPVFDHTTGNRGTRMWIPPGVDTIRGIVIVGNGAGGDSRDAVFIPWHPGLAQTHGFAVIGTSG